MSTPCISHVEWRCSDLDGTRAFLESLFGWSFRPWGRRYVEADPGHGAFVALLQTPEPGAAGACQGYIRIDGLADCLRRAEALGGGIETGATEIPGYGRYACVRAPDGTVFGLFEAGH